MCGLRDQFHDDESVLAGASVSGHLISFQGGALFRDTTSEHRNIHEHVTHDEEMMTRREIWKQRATQGLRRLMEDREKCVTFNGKVLTTETIKLLTNYTIVRVVQAASGGRHKDKWNKGDKLQAVRQKRMERECDEQP